MKKILFVLALICTTVISNANNPEPIMAKAAICVACHGQLGISSNPEWPNLAGQHASYLLKQLHDFKEGKTRNAATMAAVVAMLSESDMVALANFYAKQPLSTRTSTQHFKRGELLYRGGDFAKHITACIACHGPTGKGNAQAGFPLLSGQHALYTIEQLQAFKEGKRTNDLNSIMRDISTRMDKEDMKAVADYIQSLH